MVAREFEIGDLVWAKMKGYPDWPAKIEAPPPGVTKKNQHYVFFFGSNNYAWIPDERINHHSEEFLQKVNLKKKNFGYSEGVEEIKKESQRKPLKKPKVSLSISKDEKKELKKQSFSKSSNRVTNENSLKTKQSATPPQKNVTPEKKTSKKRRSTSDGSSSKKVKIIDHGYDDLFDAVLPSIGHAISVFKMPEEQKETSDESSEIVNETVVPVPVPVPEVVEVKPVKKEKVEKKRLIGFLGLGMMGQGMVKNLSNFGHNLVVWNRTPSKFNLLEDTSQITKAETPADVVKQCEVTFCCVADPHAVRNIVFGENGVLKGLRECMTGGKGYVEMTSIDAETSQELAEAITNAGMKYLEAPIIGSRKCADDGTILILGAGDRDLFNECEDCFHAMSKHAYYLSCDVGKSANINIIASMFLGTMYSALAEALALTERVDLEKSDLLEILKLRGVTTPPLMDKGKAIIRNKFLPDTFLKHQQKDLNLCLRLSDKYNQPLPVAAAAHGMYVRAKGLGCHDHDSAGVYLAYKY